MRPLMQWIPSVPRGGRLAALLLFAPLLGSACGNQIGDSCRINIDCSPLGERFCDASSPGGYCTIEGCDVSSCPGNSVCVRFFQPLPDRPCEPRTMRDDCTPSELCLCDCGAPDASGQCPAEVQTGTNTDGMPILQCGAVTGGQPVPKAGHCAPEASERRWCQQRCKNDGNCRDDVDAQNQRVYQCRETGRFGAEPIPTAVTDAGVTVGPAVKFCAQRVK